MLGIAVEDAVEATLSRLLEASIFLSLLQACGFPLFTARWRFGPQVTEPFRLVTVCLLK